MEYLTSDCAPKWIILSKPTSLRASFNISKLEKSNFRNLKPLYGIN